MTSPDATSSTLALTVLAVRPIDAARRANGDRVLAGFDFEAGPFIFRGCALVLKRDGGHRVQMPRLTSGASRMAETNRNSGVTITDSRLKADVARAVAARLCWPEGEPHVVA